MNKPISIETATKLKEAVKALDREDIGFGLLLQAHAINESGDIELIEAVQRGDLTIREAMTKLGAAQ
jgi:hypothetical protein